MMQSLGVLTLTSVSILRFGLLILLRHENYEIVPVDYFLSGSRARRALRGVSRGECGDKRESETACLQVQSVIISATLSGIYVLVCDSIRVRIFVVINCRRRSRLNK